MWPYSGNIQYSLRSGQISANKLAFHELQSRSITAGLPLHRELDSRGVCCACGATSR
ncbi:hypothetical protein F751_4783 [Auxenochlorella protothecoides]|uniref:Uncharacterized protein n=1 Tax=Auxenochlorella protothecoides TaxID=3075 RepID=A0A087SKN6_AUXPR|nr:hypothetical protein F751_4783 [Auxenochlorella protothecoides]KFM26290.1 hypothetical protein F751_4783 [Auxenochlorella protothecoides]